MTYTKSETKTTIKKTLKKYKLLFDKIKVL